MILACDVMPYDRGHLGSDSSVHARCQWSCGAFGGGRGPLDVGMGENQ